MKYKTLLFTALCFVSLQMVGQKYLPVRCLITYPDTNSLEKDRNTNKNWIEHLWYYDKQDRVITDSIYSPEHNFGYAEYTKHYRYGNGAIFIDGGRGASTIQLKNNKGWITDSYYNSPLNFGFTKTIYNSDGTPQSITDHTTNYSKDTFDIDRVYDSLNYVNSNLIYFRTTVKWQVHKEKSYGTIFSFYRDTFYKYKPDMNKENREKIFRASIDPIGVLHYNKDLVKTMRFLNTNENYTYDYEFDDNGNITCINEVRIDARGIKFYQKARFEYSCKEISEYPLPTLLQNSR